MIKNYMCENCDHSIVCEISQKKLSVFHEEAKKDLGVTITINECSNYKEIE